MAKFAGYGFNKSHAAAYAVISYQTGFLKTHFPVEFLAASMSLDINNTDKLAAFAQEAKRLSIPIIAPDILKNRADFDVEDGTILYALAAVKGVGMEAMRHLVSVRETGPFKDLHDFAERVDPRHINKKCLESLAKAGALDKLEPNRARALAAVPVLAATAQSAEEQRTSNQVSLFGDQAESLRAPLPRSAPWSASEKLDHEFKAVGFFLSGHPLDDLLQGTARDRVVLAAEREEVAREREYFDMVGLVRIRNERPAQSGGKFAYLTLSDPTGEFEVMVSPELLQEVRDEIEPGASVFCRIRARIRDDELRLALDGVVPLAKASLGAGQGLRIHMASAEGAEGLSRIAEQLARAPGTDRGEIRVALRLEDRRHVNMILPGRYPVGVAALQLLKTAPGVEKVEQIET